MMFRRARDAAKGRGNQREAPLLRPNLPALPGPAYGSGTLGDLFGSIGAHLGMRSSDVFGLPAARRYVVLMVDGLGWEQLGEYGTHAGPLGAASGARPIAVGLPTTTVTSLASLGTGLTPGRHGMVGHSFRLDDIRFAPLRTTPYVYALDVQPQLTWFERFTKAGVSANVVAPATFTTSLFTGAVLRGARFLGVGDEHDVEGIVQAATIAASIGDVSVTYVYMRSLDQAGHLAGLGSEPWLDALRFAGTLTDALRAALPRDTLLLVTGDHGIVNVPMQPRTVIEQVPALAAGVEMVAGEARFRHLYAAPRDVAGVVQRWENELGDTAWVRTREEAIADGWFGPVPERMAARIGDVVVAAQGTSAVFTITHERELQLRGMHGSFTPAEMLVPLLWL